MAAGIRGREKKVDLRFDKRLVVVAERGARQFLFQPIRKGPAAELVLKSSVAVMVENR